MPEKTAWRVKREKGETVAARKIEEEEDEDDEVPSRTDHDHFVQSFLMSRFVGERGGIYVVT